MKLIIAIIRDHDNENVSNALTTAGFRITYVASTGGFLHRGSSTLLIGLEDGEVEKALQLVRSSTTPPSEPNTKSATVFVLKVDQYSHL